MYAYIYSSNNLLTLTASSFPFSIPSDIYCNTQFLLAIVESKFITPAFLSIVNVGFMFAVSVFKPYLAPI